MKKVVTSLILMIFLISFLSVVSADNNTTNATETSEIEDIANYIIPVSITDNGIKFNDGFTGFCIDLGKNSITTDDKFTSEPTTDSENAIKSAIIECYKSDKESDIENIISKVINKDTSDAIVEKALSSAENIGDSAVVEINNDTEATFNFELLKSIDDEKSDCLAYNVSLKTIEHEDELSAVNDKNMTNDDADNNTKIAQTSDNNTDISNDKTEETGNNNISSEDKTEDTPDNSTTDTTEKTVTETNKTIVNKTNTVIINENNTTVINQNNTKIIDKTNETPQNATIQDTIMKATGNPIVLLVIVIIIVFIVAVTIRRKG